MPEQLSLFGDQLSPGVDELFRELAVPVKKGELESIKAEIWQYVEKIVKAQRKNEFLNADLARKISETCIYLLDSYTKYPKDQKALISGAVKYFLLCGDQDSDIGSPLGFDDDAEVLNYVLNKIGRKDLLIDIEEEF